MGCKVAESVLVRVAVSKSDQAGESLEEPWVASVCPLVERRRVGEGIKQDSGEQRGAHDER